MGPAVTTRAATHATASRVQFVDIVRGAVMLLMAIDHVRVFAGVSAGGVTPGLFVTRWITNFCAPAFVFFAGTSIFLHAERLRDPGALSRWLHGTIWDASEIAIFLGSEDLVNVGDPLWGKFRRQCEGQSFTVGVKKDFCDCRPAQL